MLDWLLNALLWVAKSLNMASQKVMANDEISQNAFWPGYVCTPEYFSSAHSPVCSLPVLLSPSLSSFFPQHICHFSDISLSCICEAFNVRWRGWSGRVWNMKQSYVRRWGAELNICVQENSLSHPHTTIVHIPNIKGLHIFSTGTHTQVLPVQWCGPWHVMCNGLCIVSLTYTCTSYKMENGL